MSCVHQKTSWFSSVPSLWMTWYWVISSHNHDNNDWSQERHLDSYWFQESGRAVQNLRAVQNFSCFLCWSWLSRLFNSLWYWLWCERLDIELVIVTVCSYTRVIFCAVMCNRSEALLKVCVVHKSRQLSTCVRFYCVTIYVELYETEKNLQWSIDWNPIIMPTLGPHSFW